MLTPIAGPSWRHTSVESIRNHRSDLELKKIANFWLGPKLSSRVLSSKVMKSVALIDSAFRRSVMRLALPE